VQIRFLLVCNFHRSRVLLTCYLSLTLQVKKVKQDSATVKGELSALKGAKHSLETQVEHEVSSNRKQIENMARTEMLLKEREQEHSLGLRRYTAELNQMKSQLQMERQKRVRLYVRVTHLVLHLCHTSTRGPSPCVTLVSHLQAGSLTSYNKTEHVWLRTSSIVDWSSSYNFT
jgi:hypothetical protein